MISLIVCTHRVDKIAKHKEHIRQTIGTDFEYILIDNSGGKYSLASAYNRGVEEAKGEYCIFCHDDLFFISQGWGDTITTKFKENPDVGLIGVAGTEYLLKEDPLWFKVGMPFLKGKVIHKLSGHSSLILSLYGAEEGDSEVVAVDGLFMAIRRELFNKISFDEATFDGFHFYDIDITMQVRRYAKALVTTDIMVKHCSGGNFQQEWEEYRLRFMEKYESHFPISCANTVSDLSKRVPFESIYLNEVVSAESYAYIESIGAYYES